MLSNRGDGTMGNAAEEWNRLVSSSPNGLVFKPPPDKYSAYGNKMGSRCWNLSSSSTRQTVQPASYGSDDVGPISFDHGLRPGHSICQLS